jgi:hypothetical protein
LDFEGPPITLSIDSSRISSVISFALNLIDKIAASLTTFSNSAAENPGVLAAIFAQSTSGDIFLRPSFA